MNEQGETIVEVLLATVIISIVLATAFSLSNRATRLNQTSVERTTVSNLMREQAERIRGLRTAAGNTSVGSVWTDEILSRSSVGSPVYDATNPCQPTNTNSFYVDAANSVQDYDTGSPFTDAFSSDIFRIWVEGYRDPASQYVDLHVRACWEGIGGEAMQRSGIILRLAT